MKKKGFTLIELLAVIVVLAIIALIATPIVMNTIKNSKKGAAERTADNYTDQVETSLMTYRLENGSSVPNGEYEIDSKTGNLCLDEKCNELLPVEMNGTKPSSGSIVIENGQVKKDRTTMKVGDYTVKYDTTKKTFVASESAGSNVEVLCTAVTELSTQFVYDQGNIQTGVLASDGDPYAYGVEYTCELGDNDSKTFYVLENNEDTVSLIMNMNIDSEGKGTTSGNTVAWSSYGSNLNGPDTAKAYLEEQTSGWTKLSDSQISLPSAEQIATASGQTFSQTNISELPTWLYENLYVNSSVPAGYWTSTPYASDSDYAWYVHFAGSLNRTYVGDSNRGVRPVITISKSQLG